MLESRYALPSSENSVIAKYAEFPFYEVGLIRVKGRSII